MKHAARVVFALACLASAVGAANPALLEPRQALILVSPSLTPPPDTGWEPVALPDDAAHSRPSRQKAPTWYRIAFGGPPAPATGEPWAAYLPYLYDGGQVWLNGVLLTRLPESNAQVHARTYRPFMVPIPAPLLRADANELAVRAAPPETYPLRFPRVTIGPQAEIAPLYDRRLFWVRTVPQLTVISSLVIAACVLFIWWRRRSEVLYGLFGLAAALWGVRSLTFVIDTMTVTEWHWWRMIYHSATGGFVVAMALFTLRFAGLRRPWLERALIAYWFVGPLWFALRGFVVEPLVAQVWLGGMIPIGLSIIALAFWSVRRQHTLMSRVLPAAMAFAVLVGIHDYLITWNAIWLEQWLPGWAGHRIYLLHYGSNALLFAMGALLTVRFIQTLGSLEDLNRTLETRVADRERALAGNYARVAALEREHAASEERQLIMRDLHDGLGSQLFTSLSRVERGGMDNDQMAAALRACIADMRLALDALASDDHNIGSAVGNFMFRWEAQLVAAGIRPRWDTDVPVSALTLPPHAALQLLRVAQEALTNVIKHAGATRVEVRLHQIEDQLEMEIEDDGGGLAGSYGAGHGHGLSNMRSRAEQLGGQLDVRSGNAGTRVMLRLPMTASVA